MWWNIRIIASLLAAVLALSYYEDIVLVPKQTSGPVSVLYFGQGADIATSQYVDIMTNLQNSVNFPLWIGIPQCSTNVCSIPNSLARGIDRISKKMVSMGMKAYYSFYGGHSLGGAMMPGYVNDHVAETAAGMILWAAFLTHTYKIGKTTDGRPKVVFPVKTLTIGGELDGLCRITRIAEALYSQVTFSSDPDTAAITLPVTVIGGIDHMRFASGIAPKFVKDNDLQAEVNEADAHDLIVKDTATFMYSIVYPDVSSHQSALRNRVQESTAFLQPIIDALLMEAFAEFLPPCYCEAVDEYGGLQYGTCTTTSSCYGGVDWTSQYAQPFMAGVNDQPEVRGLSVAVADSMHIVTEEHPSCHLPHIHGNPEDSANPGANGTPPICSDPHDCLLNITTVTQHLYDSGGEIDIWRAHFDVSWLDTGFLPIASKELKTKLKSRQAIWQAAGLINTDFTKTDSTVEKGGQHDICGQINQEAINWALSKLPPTNYRRFQTYGQQLVIGPDLSTCKAGPCWIWDPLRFKKDDEKNIVTVQSVWFGSENKNLFPCGESKTLPCSAGFHYCKLLSPARAVEWMYVDGLRNKFGTKDDE